MCFIVLSLKDDYHNPTLSLWLTFKILLPSHRACIKCLGKIPWYGLKPCSKQVENETLIKWGRKCLVIKLMNFYGSQIALHFESWDSKWVLNLSIVSFNLFPNICPFSNVGFDGQHLFISFKETNHMLMKQTLFKSNDF